MATATKPKKANYHFRAQNSDAYHYKGLEMLLAGPAGTGKSVTLLVKVLTLLTKYPKCRGLFCRGTRSSLTQTGLVTWEEVLDKFGYHRIARQSTRRVRQSYEFRNGSELVVAGLDDPGKTLSSDYDFVYIQEATEEGITLDTYETLLRCLRHGKLTKSGSVPYHQIMADCNPTAPTHWLYRRYLSGKLRLFTSTHHDNPAYWDTTTNDYTPVGRTYIEDTLARMTGSRRSRFYTGEWKTAEGIIYDGFNNALAPIGHLHPFGWQPEKHWRRVWAIDWGFINPTALVMGALDEDDRLHLYKEYYATHTRDEDLGRWAREQIELGLEPLPIMTVCDHDPQAMATFQRYGPENCPIRLADKGDKVGGIEEMQGLFDFQGDGRPRIYFTEGMRANPLDTILEAAGKPTSTIEELLGYEWDTRNPDRIKDEPIDRNNHSMDACRYLCRWLSAYTQKAPPRRHPPKSVNPFGRLKKNTWNYKPRQ